MMLASEPHCDITAGLPNIIMQFSIMKAFSRTNGRLLFAQLDQIFFFFSGKHSFIFLKFYFIF